MHLSLLLKTLRPHQWVKNVFVLAPLVFSRNLTSPAHALRGFVGFALFCLASGIVYLVNDLVDAERDRLHPIKRNRPIASGALSPTEARLWAALGAPAVLLGAWLLSPPLSAVIAGYMTLNLFYSIVLKRIPYLDVLSIATGFLLRVVGGAYAVAVPASHWLLGCTVLLASTLALGKRAHELAVMGDEATAVRGVLARYRLSHLRVAMLAVATVTGLGYALYTLSPATRATFDTSYLVLTTPFPIFGLYRFTRLVMHPHRKSSPTDEMLRDVPFLVTLFSYGVAVLLILYHAP